METIWEGTEYHFYPGNTFMPIAKGLMTFLPSVHL